MIILAQIQPSNIPEDPANRGWYLVIVVVSAAIGWGIEHWRKGKEIKKLTAEIRKLEAEVKKIETEEIKLAGDMLKELQHAREKHTASCKQCSEAATVLVSLIQGKNRQEDIQTAREQFCASVTEAMLPAYCSFVEWQALIRKNRPDELVSFIRSDVIPELQRIQRWLQIINAPMFTDGYGQECLHIEERSMRAFFDLARFIPEDRKAEIQEPLFTGIRGVTGTGS